MTVNMKDLMWSIWDSGIEVIETKLSEKCLERHNNGIYPIRPVSSFADSIGCACIVLCGLYFFLFDEQNKKKFFTTRSHFLD